MAARIDKLTRKHHRTSQVDPFEMMVDAIGYLNPSREARGLMESNQANAEIVGCHASGGRPARVGF